MSTKFRPFMYIVPVHSPGTILADVITNDFTVIRLLITIAVYLCIYTAMWIIYVIIDTQARSRMIARSRSIRDYQSAKSEPRTGATIRLRDRE